MRREAQWRTAPRAQAGTQWAALFEAVYVPNLAVRGSLWNRGGHSVCSHSGSETIRVWALPDVNLAQPWPGVGQGLCPGVLSGDGVSACCEEPKGNISGPERKPEGKGRAMARYYCTDCDFAQVNI